MQETVLEKQTLGSRLRSVIEDAILASRYLLIPMLLGLFVVILLMTLDFFKVLIGTSHSVSLIDHTMLALELLDTTMVANLIWLISAGSYYVFVDNTYPEKSVKRRPRCLTHVSSGVLKEKMAGSLIGVSSVHLLQIFLQISESKETIDWRWMGAMLSIHLAFILGLMAFNYANQADHHDHAQEESASENTPQTAHA